MVTNEVTILLANPSETNDLKVELIDQQIGTLKKIMTIIKKEQEKKESLTENLTTTQDGIDEPISYDDESSVDYDLDYTVQY